MSVKKKSKAKSKTGSKAIAKKSGQKAIKNSGTSKKKPVDIVKVREKISDMVGGSARDIASEVIKVAKTGQLASAKYLFEAVGLFPPTEDTMAKPKEDSLAMTLLRRMGLPTEPVVVDDDDAVAFSSLVKCTTKENIAVKQEDDTAEETGDAGNATVAEDGEELP